MSRDRLPTGWIWAVLTSAREWVATGEHYPMMVGTIQAIIACPDYSESQKLERIRIVLDAVHHACAERPALSIPQQGGDDHDM